MKILVYDWRDIRNPEAGGAEVFTHEVTLFTSEFNGCKKEEVIDGVRVVRAGGRYSVYSEAKEHYRRYLCEEGFEVVIDEVNTRPFFTPRFVDNEKKIIALVHQLAREYSFYETPFPLSLIGYYFLEKRWLRNYVDLPAITVSESTRKDLVDLGFKKVFVASEGISFDPLREIPEKEKDPTVIYLGRLKKAKRPDLVVKAFGFVRKEMPNAGL